MSSTGALRAVVHRLSSTPNHELPRVASFLATSLESCGSVLQSDHRQKSGNDDEASVLVHSLKIKLSSLLQDRSIGARWTGAVLVKATIEAGGWEILKGCEPWARGLLAILAVRQTIS